MDQSGSEYEHQNRMKNRGSRLSELVSRFEDLEDKRCRNRTPQQGEMASPRHRSPEKHAEINFGMLQMNVAVIISELFSKLNNSQEAYNSSRIFQDKMSTKLDLMVNNIKSGCSSLDELICLHSSQFCEIISKLISEQFEKTKLELMPNFKQEVANLLGVYIESNSSTPVTVSSQQGDLTLAFMSSTKTSKKDRKHERTDTASRDRTSQHSIPISNKDNRITLDDEDARTNHEAITTEINNTSNRERYVHQEHPQMPDDEFESQWPSQYKGGSQEDKKKTKCPARKGRLPMPTTLGDYSEPENDSDSPSGRYREEDKVIVEQRRELFRELGDHFNDDTDDSIQSDVSTPSRNQRSPGYKRASMATSRVKVEDARSRMTEPLRQAVSTHSQPLQMQSHPFNEDSDDSTQSDVYKPSRNQHSTGYKKATVESSRVKVEDVRPEMTVPQRQAVSTHTQPLQMQSNPFNEDSDDSTQSDVSTPSRYQRSDDKRKTYVVHRNQRTQRHTVSTHTQPLQIHGHLSNDDTDDSIQSDVYKPSRNQRSSGDRSLTMESYKGKVDEGGSQLTQTYREKFMQDPMVHQSRTSEVSTGENVHRWTEDRHLHSTMVKEKPTNSRDTNDHIDLRGERSDSDNRRRTTYVGDSCHQRQRSTGLPIISSPHGFPETSSSNNNDPKKTHNMITRLLGLEGVPIRSLGLSDIIAITNGDLQFYEEYIQRIIMLDYKVRDEMPLKLSENKPTPGKERKKGAHRRPKMLLTAGHINPMDVFLMLFLHSSPALKQNLVSKLFLCKLAIPFIIPETSLTESHISFWPLRGIVAEWREEGVAKEESLVTSSLYVTSFVRLGTSPWSKSTILNDLLSPVSHPIFFNRERPLGKSSRSISNGLVELAFYLPSGKPDDLMRRAGVFCNLRGDGMDFQDKIEMLQGISHAMFVFVDIAKLSNQHIQHRFKELRSRVSYLHILLSTTEESENQQEFDILDNILDEFDENQHDIVVLEDSMNKAEVKQEVVNSFQHGPHKAKGKSLESERSTLKMQCTVDENIFEKYKEHANDFLKRISQSKKPKLDYLPLQGTPWQNIVEIERTHGRDAEQSRNERSVEAYHQDVMKQRELQQKMLTNTASCLKNFIDTLNRSYTNLQELNMVILWYRIYLDQHSRNVLPALNKEYRDMYERYRHEVEAGSKKNITENILQQMELKEELIEFGSLGIEHVLREFGQIYEALVGPPKMRSPITYVSTKQLLDIAVALICSGQPFEIMNGDGDMSNIPLVWVKAVLTKLSEVLKNKKVYTISILGVQSSGKSTLLNSMFGIQFAVSAGRCTRGIFIQLVPVKNMKFEYVLIIDTEGLRANEVKRKNHDNELATISIGLGDITIVNIKGENNAEIEEVLEITVQAFLRIKAVCKNITLQQRCIFIHQNVASTNAMEKLLVGRKKLLESLDRIAAIAAKEENVVSVSKFTDVIKFDLMNDVWYFPDLWFGSPPSAHVNPAYTQEVSKVKHQIFEKYVESQKSFLKISEFSQRIEDLWKAIMSDNFVYNFRNHLELKAYGDLDEFYHKNICWAFEKELYRFMQETKKKKVPTATLR